MNFYDFIKALVPIILIIIGLGIIKKPSYYVIPICLIVTIAITLFDKNLGIVNTSLAIFEGTIMGIWPIVIVIIAAIFTYKMAESQNDMNIIKVMLSNVSSDKRIIVLLVAWGFGNFLEGVAGYGTAVAIPVSILIAMGFEPFFACLICLIMNTSSTAYGSVGIPIISLAQATELDIKMLSYNISLQLILPTLIVPFVLVMLVGGGIKALKGSMFILTLLSGASIAISQIYISKTLGPELPAILGSITAMIIIVIYAKLFETKDTTNKNIKVSVMQGFLACLPYTLMVSLIIIISPLFYEINKYVSTFKTTLSIYPEATPLQLKWLTSPGLLIIIATVVSYLIRGVSIIEQIKVFILTIKKMALSSFVIICIVSISRLMTHSGMIKDLADGISTLTSTLYPLFSPLIGTLGTFLTGSDTVSNVLFGPLQTQIAANIDANPYWLSAANTTGATGGKMISPQNITIATTTAGLIGQEGKLLSKTIPYALGYILISGVLVYCLS
ncbi:lactate permease LctP family transporter [Borrelia anserina]|uniref:L-lactate permease n=2 Tax=Borrelia anserina TaxID=143 RepID=W5SNT9_BORAN|nr:lactate permease LctP family transporter [Borrelia anserina]AHH08577.1 L-lactate permease [Borrelia anserina BA2]APR65044.1 lactate permease [Borrelia anserina Es]UPA06968.1 lactate permease LctP family transporter [Borrelia anserina]